MLINCENVSIACMTPNTFSASISAVSEVTSNVYDSDIPNCTRVLDSQDSSDEKVDGFNVILRDENIVFDSNTGSSYALLRSGGNTTRRNEISLEFFCSNLDFKRPIAFSRKNNTSQGFALMISNLICLGSILPVILPFLDVNFGKGQIGTECVKDED